MNDESESDYTEELQRGIVLFQYTKTLQCNKAVLYVNKSGEQICCKQLRVLLPAPIEHHDIMDILGFILGPKSKTFSQILHRKQHLLRRIPSWCCFSIICKSLTLDFRVNSELDEDRIISIFLGLQRLMTNPSNRLLMNPLNQSLNDIAPHIQQKRSLSLSKSSNPKWPWTYSSILAKRGWMKVEHLATQRNQTRLQLLTHNAKTRGIQEKAEHRRRRRSLWSHKGNAWNQQMDLPKLPPHQCIVYRQTINDFLEKLHQSLREPATDRGWNELYGECRRFASILKNESNLDLEACRLFNRKLESILTESDMLSTASLTDSLSVHLPMSSISNLNSNLNRVTGNRPHSKLTVDVREDANEEMEEEKYDTTPMLQTAYSLEQKANSNANSNVTETGTISTMQSEHGMLTQEEEEKYNGGSRGGREEKVNSNQNQSHSMHQEVDDISAEFEYFETLMTAFAESVSSTNSERQQT